MSTCKNVTGDVLNALYTADKATAQLTIVFSPYMNCGRWNHNTSRIDSLITALVSKGYSVQLQHDPKETTGDHGYVVVSLHGEVLSQHKTAQHNKNYRDREGIFKEMLPTIVAAVEKAVAEEKTGSSDKEETAERPRKKSISNMFGLLKTKSSTSLVSSTKKQSAA